MLSSVSLICRFSSILSSIVPRMWAMARCSGRGGRQTSKRAKSDVLRYGRAVPETTSLKSKEDRR
jgi:hypothetical protein